MPTLPLRPALRKPPAEKAQPAPVFFRSASLPEAGTYPRHLHPWGEFVYSYSGVMEVKARQQHFLAPPQYGIWLPPRLEHVGLKRYEASHCSVYIEAARCAGLPREACALTVSSLVRALLDHLRRQP